MTIRKYTRITTHYVEVIDLTTGACLLRGEGLKILGAHVGELLKVGRRLRRVVEVEHLCEGSCLGALVYVR